MPRGQGVTPYPDHAGEGVRGCRARSRSPHAGGRTSAPARIASIPCYPAPAGTVSHRPYWLIVLIRAANPSISFSSTSIRVMPMLVSASAVSVSGPRTTSRSTPSAERILQNSKTSWTNARPGMITTSSSFDKFTPARSSAVMRQAISFLTLTTRER